MESKTAKNAITKRGEDMFMNYHKGDMMADAVECRHGRWYILMGFAGFNSRANNRDGYETREKAEAAIRKYQG